MRRYVILFAAMVLTGCSGGSSVPSASKPVTQVVHRLLNQYSCPVTGPIVYVSDYNNAVVNVYNGDLAGQAPCGQLGSRESLSGPNGLYVYPATHDLYVANGGISSVKVFHRGQIKPYNSYVDQSRQFVSFQDVAVAKDGTLVANTDCSLSTWIVGPNGGTFVGHFDKNNCQESYASFITVDTNDAFYYDGEIGGFFNPYPAVFSLSCPRGACGPQKKLYRLRPALLSPAGMAFDAAGDLLVTVNGVYPPTNTERNGSTAETFELPNPTPQVFHMTSRLIGDMAINQGDTHWFIAKTYDGADEYSYPDGALIGHVAANANGYMDGIAVDR